MRLLKTSLNHEFNLYVLFKVSFTLTLSFFNVSTVLHLVFTFIYPRFDHKTRHLSKSSMKISTLKPVLQFPNKSSKVLPNKLSKRYHLLGANAIKKSRKPPNVPHEHTNSDPTLEAATSVSPTALTPTYENRTHIAVTAIAPQQENPFASIEKRLENQTSTAWLT